MRLLSESIRTEVIKLNCNKCMAQHCGLKHMNLAGATNLTATQSRTIKYSVIVENPVNSENSFLLARYFSLL